MKRLLYKFGIIIIIIIIINQQGTAWLKNL